MNKLCFFLALLSVPFFISSCKLGATLEKADKAYKLYKFHEAADMYERVYSSQETDEAKAAVAFKAAESYRRMRDFRRAERWYRRAIRLGYDDPKIYFYYGQVMKQQEDFEDAKEQFNKMKKKAPGNPKAVMGLKSLEIYEDLKNAETRFVVDDARRLNSSNNDYAANYAGTNENTVIFTSDRENTEGNKTYEWTGLPYSDLFSTEWDRRREKWQDPKPLEGTVNTDYNEGVASFDKRGREMYYTQCNGPDGEEDHCRIMVAKQRGREWKDPKKLPFCTDTTVNYGHPTLSRNGKRLYFSSDMPGGYGKHDIYVSHYVSRSRTWGDPVNLGPAINTEGDELFPYLYKNNRLYFASDGQIGMGGLDIFVSEFDGENWSEPENLKYPVNSHGDDFAIVFNEKGDKGFFSSNREGRGDDIYTFYMIPKECALTGVVYNLKTKKPVKNATVTLYSNRKNFKPVTLKTGKDGKYLFDEKFDCDFQYEVNANKDKFFASPREYVSATNVEVSKTFERDLYIDPFPIQSIKLEGIYYGLDSFNLRPKSIPVLDSLVKVLTQNPNIVVELASHTDCRATYKYNDTLSQKRAQSVVTYLVDNGIDSLRLVPKGYGERELVNNCSCEDGEGPGIDCTEKEHQQNRRTTFGILRTDYQPKEEEIDFDDTSPGEKIEKSPEKGDNP